VAKKRAGTTALQSQRWCRWCDDEPRPDRVSQHPHGFRHHTELYPDAWFNTRWTPEVKKARVMRDLLGGRLAELEAYVRKDWGNGPVPLTCDNVPPPADAKVDWRAGNAYVALRDLSSLRKDLRDGDPDRALLRLADVAFLATAGKRWALGKTSGPKSAQKRHAEHVETKVKPYREEHQRRLQAGEKSADIIEDMAKKYDPAGWAKNAKWATKRMRDIIKPREQRKT
jgi:hypothetical protein